MSTEEDLSKLRGWKDVLSISESTAGLDRLLNVLGRIRTDAP